MAKNQGRINFGVGFNVDKSGLTSAFNDLKQQLVQLQNLTTQDILRTDGLKIAQKDLKDIQNLASQVQGILERSFNAKLNTTDLTKFNQGLKDSTITVQKIQTEFSKAGTVGTNAFRNLTTQLLTTNKYIKESSHLLDKMAETLSNTVRWTIASSALNSFTGSIQKAYSFTKQLDSSLNDIMIVTGKSSDQMAEFAKQANTAAKNLGSVTTDYTKASLIYYQQGLSDSEVKARASTTVKVANITKQSADSVSEQLTAVWNGYKVNASEAELYVDKLSAVAARTAADLEELSTGMSRVASAANIMGVDIDQLNAQLATIVSVTREAPESIGTALKTVYARMSDIEAGLDTETTLGEYTKQMAEMGIKVLDANGNLRDMGDVVEEIGDKWNTLNRNQQASLAQTIAGTRQYSRMMALFDNWNMYEDALAISQHSAGELQKQQDEYMKSMESHLNRLQAEGEELYQTLFNAEDLNPMIDGLTAIVGGIENIIEAIGGGRGLISVLGAVGLNVFGDKITSGISRTVRNIQGYKENLDNATQEAAIIEEYELSTDRTDARTAHILSLKKELLKVSDSLTKEEIEAANTFIKQTNELYKQQDAFEENKNLLEQMTKLATGKGLQLDEYGNISQRREKALLNNLQEKRFSLTNEKNWIQNNYLDSFNQISTLDIQRKGQQRLSKFYATKAQTFWDKNNLEMRRANLETGRGSELYTEKSIALLKEYEALLAKSAEANQRALNNEEQLKQLLLERKEAYEELQGSIETFGLEVKDLPKDAQKEFKALQQILESTFESAKTGELLEPGEYKKASEALQQYIDLLKQLGVDTKKAEEVLKTFNEENAKTNGALDENRAAADKLKSSFDLTKAIGSVVDFAGALANVASGMQTLVNLPSIWNNDDLTTGEKFVQTLTNMSFGLGMVASSVGPVISGLRAFFGIQTAVTAAEIANTASTAAATLAKDRKTKVTSEEVLATLALNKTLDEAAKKRIADAVAAKFEGEAIENVTEDKLKEVLTEEMKQQNPSGAKQLFNGGKNLLGKLGNSKFGQATGGKIAGALGKGGAAATTGGAAAAGTGIAAGIVTAIGVAAVIAAIATVTYVAIKAYNKKTDALKSAIKEEERLKEVAADVRREYEEINSLIDEYGSLTEKIDELTDGTHEWREAIMQANEKALELIQTYDNLQWSYNSDGLIEIDSDSLKQIQNTALMKSVAAQNASINATQIRRGAQFDVDLQKIYREINDNSYLIEKEDDLEDIFKEWQNSANKEQFRNALVERELDETSDEGIVIYDYDKEKDIAAKTIDDLILSFEELNKSVEKNNKLVQIENQQKYQNMLMAQGQDNAAAISGIISTKTSDAYEEQVEKEKERVKKQRESIDNQEWIIQWGASQGLDLDKGTIKESGRNTFKYQDTNGNWHSVEYNDAYEQLARANIDASNMNLEAIANAKEILSTTVDGLSNEFANTVSSVFVGNKVIDTSAIEDYSWQAIQDLEQNITELGNTIEEETKTALENSVKALKDGLEKINTEQGWTEGIDDKVASVLEEGAIYNSNIWTKYSKKTITIIGNALNQVGVAMGDGGEKIAKFLSGMGDAAADFISGIDWNSENLVEDFADQCLKLGREIDYTDNNTRELLASLSAMNGELMGSKEAFGKISAIISGLSGYGDSISQEDYTKLYSQYGVLIDKYFTQMKDGTYVLTDAANDFRAELESLEKMKIQQQLNDLINSFGSNEDKESLINKINDLKVGYEKINEANVERVLNDTQLRIGYGREGWSYQSVRMADIDPDETWSEENTAKALMLYLQALKTKDPNFENEIWKLDDLSKYEGSDFSQFTYGDWKKFIQGTEQTEDYLKLDDAGGSVYTDLTKKEIVNTIKDYYKTLLEEQNTEQYHDLNSLSSIISEASSLNIIDTTKANELYNLAKEEENRKVGATGSSTAQEAILEAITKFDPATQSQDDIVKLANQMLQFSTSEENFNQQVEQLKRDLKIGQGQNALLNDATWASLIESAKKSFKVAEVTEFLDTLELSIQPTLDTSQAIKDFEDLKRQLMGDDNLIELSTSLVTDFEQNQANALAYQSVIDELNERYAAGDFVGNEQSYYNELKKYTDLLKSTTLENQQIFQELQQMEIEGYKQIGEYHKEIIDLIEQQINLNELLGVSSARLNKSLRDQSIDILDNAEDRLVAAKTVMEEYSSDSTSAEYQSAVEEYREAAAAYQEAAISAIKAVDDEYIASIDNIFKEFEEGIAGSRGLKAIKDEWDWTQSLGDKYLDNINAEYGKRSVARAFDEALAINTSVKAQQVLNKIKEEELAILERKTKLTQYDLDRANQMLEVTKAQIALEEAQQDQSQMRLVRGADGTYGYEYVADQSKILEAEKNLEAAQNNLYNLDTEEYQRSLDEMYESYVAYYEKMKELASDEEGLTKEDLQLLKEMEDELIATARYSKDVEVNIGKSLSEIIGSGITADNIKNYVSAASSGMAEFATELLNKGLATYNADGSITPISMRIQGKQEDWNQARENIKGNVEEMVADINTILLGKQGEDGARSGGIYATLLDDATDYVINFDTQVRDKIIESWGAMKQAALDYSQIMSNMIQTRSRADVATEFNKKYNSENKYNLFDEDFTTNDDADTFIGDLITQYETTGSFEDLEKVKEAAIKLDKIDGGSTYQDMIEDWHNKEVKEYEQQLQKITNKFIEKNLNMFIPAIELEKFGGNWLLSQDSKTEMENILNNYSAKSEVKMGLSNVLQSIISQFDTGGYTGEWGPSGRIAMLHEKELVLNKTDTENILTAVDTMRSISNALNNNMLAALLDKLSAGASAMIAQETTKDMKIEQDVHIEAVFPNVSVASEVEEALNNIINEAAQELTRNTRG